MTADRNVDEKRTTGYNWRLAQWRVQWLIEHSTSHQILWYVDPAGAGLRNPLLRKLPNVVLH
jgi:hypothetical protein